MPVQDLFAVLSKWTPYTLAASFGIVPLESTDPASSPLLNHPVIAKLARNPSIKPVLGAARMLSKDSLLPSDHFFTALLKSKLIEDMLFLWDGDALVAHLVAKLGPNTCGHAKIVHGGLLGSICDETYGALVYCMKQARLLGSEPAVTANLTMNYRKPVPGESCLLCTVRLTKQEGRKMYLEAEIRDVDTESTLADGSALFINMKSPVPEGEGALQPALPLGQLDVGTDVEKWHNAPRYSNLCKSIGM